MTDEYNLNRFLEAQADSFHTALAEVKTGRKSSHWMWYVFPQYKGLGFSSIAQQYAIYSKEEAMAYFKHPILGNRLIEITHSFLRLENTSAFEVLGDPDYLKMKSCMTLFNAVQSETALFAQVLTKYYLGDKCLTTMAQLP